MRKSTTLAALIEVINRARPAHIVTYEDAVGAALDPRELARLRGCSESGPPRWARRGEVCAA
jgi:hypothetical protein